MMFYFDFFPITLLPLFALGLGALLPSTGQQKDIEPSSPVKAAAFLAFSFWFCLSPPVHKGALWCDLFLFSFSFLFLVLCRVMVPSPSGRGIQSSPPYLITSEGRVRTHSRLSPGVVFLLH